MCLFIIPRTQILLIFSNCSWYKFLKYIVLICQQSEILSFGASECIHIFSQDYCYCMPLKIIFSCYIPRSIFLTSYHKLLNTMNLWYFGVYGSYMYCIVVHLEKDDTPYTSGKIWYSETCLTWLNLIMKLT